MRLAAVVLVCLAAVQPLFAEAPDWEELRHSLFFMRQHYLVRSDSWRPPYNGIWRLSADGSLRKERPFFSNGSSGGTSDYFFMGDQGFLTMKGDRVLFQAWPHEYHFDAFSWRMLNRLSVDGGYLGGGWALQGPYLDSGYTSGTGLTPGVYGVARCIWTILSNSTWGQRDCSPRTIPGTTDPTEITEEDVLLLYGDSPGFIDDAVPVFTFPDLAYDGDDVLLAFDPDESWFWRGTQLGVQVYPVIDGQIQPPTQEIDLAEFSLGFSEWDGFLSALYYHPVQRRLFGNIHRIPYTSPPRENTFFSLDPVSGEAEDLTSLVGDIFPLYTFTSFGTEPDVFEQIMPIIAETPGAAGTYWTTDLWLYNPSSGDVVVALNRLASSAPYTVTLPAHGSLKLGNVLALLGGGGGGDGVSHDALHISSPYRWGEQVAAVARAWTEDPSTGGTFGHTIPTVPAPYGFSNHLALEEEFVAAHIDLDLREPGRFRHNIGIANAGSEDLTIDLVWTYKIGIVTPSDGLGGLSLPEEAITTLTVPANSVRAYDLEGLFPSEVVSGWVPRIGIFGKDPAIVWYSMVDNITGDATFAPFTNYTEITAETWSDYIPPSFKQYRMAIPVVAHLGGAEASFWRTDLFGFMNRTSKYIASSPFMVFHPGEADDCQAPVSGTEISALIDGVFPMPVETWRETTGFPPDYDHIFVDRLRTLHPDIIRAFPECAEAEDSRGGLEIMTGSWFSGISRTYTTREDGGTYGAMLPMYPPGGWPVQHFAGLEVSEDARINVGFFNGDHDHAITHKVTLYSAEGTRVAQRTFVLEPLASKQLSIQSLFPAVDLLPGTYGLTVLPLDQPPEGDDPGFQGHSWAYVSIVDNLTNDPINLW